MILYVLLLMGVLMAEGPEGHTHVPPAITGAIGLIFYNFILFSRMKDKEYDSLGKKFNRKAALKYWHVKWDNMAVSFIATAILVIWGPDIYAYSTGKPISTWQEFMYLGVGPFLQYLYKISLGRSEKPA